MLRREAGELLDCVRTRRKVVCVFGGVGKGKRVEAESRAGKKVEDVDRLL